MSRLVLPLLSQASTSPSRVVRPSSLVNSGGSWGGMVGQQFVRLLRRPENVALAVDCEQESARDIERGARALGQPRVAEMNADPSQHLLDHDRLCHIVDAAGLQPAHDMLGL